MDWLSNVTDPTDLKAIPVSKVCGWWVNATSDSPLLASGFIPTTNPTAPGLEALTGRVFPLFDLAPLYLDVNFTTWYDGSINYRHIQNPIMDFLVFDTPGGLPGLYANQTPSAQECVINWCVERMQPEVYIGNLSHHTVGQPQQPEGEAPSPWSLDADYNVFYDANFEFTPSNSTETFRVSNDTMIQTIILMAAYFPLTITASSSDAMFRYRFPALLDVPYVKLLSSDAWATDLSAKVTGLARLMTDVMMTSFDGIHSLEGTACVNEIFVSVRWKWFSLPFALLLLSLIFLLTTIFKCAEEEQDIGIWKTSALPVLMNGLRGDVRRQMGTSTKMGDVRSHARETEMKLHYGKKGYRLSGIPGSVWTSSPEQKTRTWI